MSTKQRFAFGVGGRAHGRAQAVVAALIAILALAGCGGETKLSGRYSNVNGAMRLDFQPDGKVGVGGGSTTYSVSGKTVTIETPGGKRTLTIVDEDTLTVADDTSMRLLRDRSFDCSDTDDKIGTLVLSHTGDVLLTAPAGSSGAADGPQLLGAYTDDGKTVTITQPDGAITYAHDGRDLKAESVSCKRI